ncbi:retrovirus-related pol polyprotein from transposon TNT 1-94 [Tanacetum coccineum]
MGYYVEGLGHNLFSVGQFCDSNLEAAFRRNTCFVRNLEGVDLLKGNRTTNLYTINLHEMVSASLICLIARATSTKSWEEPDAGGDVEGSEAFIDGDGEVEMGESDGGMVECDGGRVKSINGKQYVLVIVDDYSRYTLVHFLRSKDQAPEEINTFLKKIQVLLQAPVIINDCKDIRKLGVKDDIGFLSLFKSWAYKNERMYGQISSGLDLTYALSTITSQKPIKRELDLLFEAMYDDYIGGQPLAAPRTTPATLAP